MKTKAAVCYEPNTPLKVETVELDEPKVNEVLVRMTATGVCHTDLAFMKGEAPVTMPVVVGHEGAGIVEKVGPGVTTLKVGDHVVMMVSFACGGCRFCSEGRPTMCSVGFNVMATATLPFCGETRLHKGDQSLYHLFGLATFAEHAVVHERSCVKIREDAPLDVMCLLGCGVSKGIGASVYAAGVKPGESIVIWGTGGVGLAAVMGAKLAGAGKIIAVARNPKKLALAKTLGADYTVNASEGDPVAKVMELSGGGVDYAIETAGKAETILQAFGALHNGGKCIVVGMAPIGSMVNIPAYEFLLGKSIAGSVQGDIRHQADIPRLIDMYMDGKLPIDKLISKRYHGLNDANANEAFRALGAGEVMRSIVEIK